MQAAKDRSANAADQLEKSKKDKRGLVREAATLLLGKDNYDARVDEANKFLKSFADVEGPIGSSSNDDAWKDLFNLPKTEMEKEDWSQISNYKHFVVYCEPQTGTKDVGYGTSLPWDFAREAILGQDNTLLLMKDESEKGDWRDPLKKVAAITIRDEGFGVVDTNGDPTAERRNVPETINFHPLWLKAMKEKGYNELTQERIDLLLKPAADSKLRELGISQADSLLLSLEGTIQHEVFHLTAFGKLKDRENDAYEWSNCINHQDLSNPETLAYLIAVVDIADKSKVKFKPDGRIKKSKFRLPW